MARPQNPIIAQKKLEAAFNKNMSKIQEITENKSYLTSKIAFLACINYYKKYYPNDSVFDLCDMYMTIYEKIRHVEDLNEIIKLCNSNKELITIEDLETAYPKEFMTYSSI